MTIHWLTDKDEKTPHVAKAIKHLEEFSDALKKADGVLTGKTFLGLPVQVSPLVPEGKFIVLSTPMGGKTLLVNKNFNYKLTQEMLADPVLSKEADLLGAKVNKAVDSVLEQKPKDKFFTGLFTKKSKKKYIEGAPPKTSAVDPGSEEFTGITIYGQPAPYKKGEMQAVLKKGDYSFNSGMGDGSHHHHLPPLIHGGQSPDLLKITFAKSYSGHGVAVVGLYKGTGFQIMIPHYLWETGNFAIQWDANGTPSLLPMV